MDKMAEIEKKIEELNKLTGAMDFKLAMLGKIEKANSPLFSYKDIVLMMNECYDEMKQEKEVKSETV